MMKFLKTAAVLLIAVLMLGGLAACERETVSDGGESQIGSGEVSEMFVPNEEASVFWKDEYAGGGFDGPDDLGGAEYFKNGLSVESLEDATADDDARLLFRGADSTRAVVQAEGYALTLPGTGVSADFELGALRSKYYGDDYVVTVTHETQNPYGNDPNGWNIYLTEWLNIRIDDVGFLSANKLRRTRAAATYTDWLDGYEVMVYNNEIRDSEGIEYPFYDIAVIREVDEYVEFYLVVMKSTEKDLDRFDEVIKSFTRLEPTGTPRSDEHAIELKVPEYWSDETKAYYELLTGSDSVRWGMFTGSMPEDGAANYQQMFDRISSEQARLEEAFDYDLDILPTYTHIGWGDQLTGFPLEMANALAGGNGFNGKPVLQFTYQFTTLNNTGLNGYTPMFDVLRGEYDEHFRSIARDIKAYGKPVLFRLNNEMNTDWTSYCGIVTLLDPDIFIETWERLYDIFREEGVDNCIWIWNPIAVSCPYSNWGEALNYLPGPEYVQALGLTNYEMNNGDGLSSFADMYTLVYNNSMPWFDNYPWIISEFACGAGGEKLYDWGVGGYVDTVLDRNQSRQATWVREMFKAFNDTQNEQYFYASHIKAAVWFSTNDYATVDGKNYITNKLELTSNLAQTLEEFRKGLAESKLKENKES